MEKGRKETNTGDTAATIHHAEEVKGFYARSLISYLESPTSCILQMLLFLAYKTVKSGEIINLRELTSCKM